MSDRPLVLDASILVKAISIKPLTDQARALMASRRRFLAPDLMPIELGNVLSEEGPAGRHERGTGHGGPARHRHPGPCPDSASGPYQPRALAIALNHGRSFHDSLYLAVAETEGGIFMTAR